MRNKIRLNTLTDINDFITAISDVEVDVFLVDPIHRYKINAKSQLACMLAGAEWNSTWVECEKDIYHLIERWVTNE